MGAGGARKAGGSGDGEGVTPPGTVVVSHVSSEQMSLHRRVRKLHK